MAIYTPTALKATFDSTITTNGVGAITGANLNQALTDIVDSIKDWNAWAEFRDSNYTEAAPFSVVAETDTVLPNNGVSGVQTYKPTVDLYNKTTQKITGRQGEALMITIDMATKPTSAATTLLEWWLDIGGAIGELYRRPFTFPKGAGIERHVSFTQFVYTLDTWQANGATSYVRANGPIQIYDIRYLIQRCYVP